MNKLIIILTIFVGSLNTQAQGVQLQNYRFNSGGVDYYALPYSNAIIIDYWARKGVYSEKLINDMNTHINFIQANSNILLEKLKGCLELSREGMAVATSSTVEGSMWKAKYDNEHANYERYKKSVKTGVIFGGGFIAVLLLSTVLLK